MPKMTIENGVLITYIPDDNQESVTIPEGITHIGEKAFYKCTSLTRITLPNSLTSIGKGAFYGCTGLTSINLPENLTSIGKGVFSYCKSLTQIMLAEGLTSIGNSAFYFCTNLTSINLPVGLASIGECAFLGCASLTSITLPVGLASIGWRAFSDCTSLITLTLPDSITHIGKAAFYKCTSLTSISIPATLYLQLLLEIGLPKNIEIIRLPMQTAKAVDDSYTLNEHDTTNLASAHAVSSFFLDIFRKRGIPHSKENVESKKKENIRLPVEIINKILGYVYHDVPERRFTLIDYKNDYLKELNNSNNNQTFMKQSIFLGQLSKDKAAALENKKRLELHSKSERLEIFVQAKSLNNKRWPH